MGGIPVVVVPSGGIPVTPVSSGGAPATLSDRGTAVTVCSNGAPFVIAGYNPQPAPPGPDNRNVEALGPGNPVVIPYNKLFGVTVIRVEGINTGGTAPGITATYGALPFTAPPGCEVSQAIAGTPFCAFLYLNNAATGSQDITVSATGTLTLVSVRTGPLVSLSSIGTVVSSTGAEGLVDIDFTPVSPGGGQLSSQACFADDSSYPVTQYYGATTQYSSFQVTTGAEKLTNGDFASGTGWSGTSWIISGGVATCTATGGRILQQTVAIPVGRYVAAMTINTIPSGSFGIYTLAGSWSAKSPAYTTVGAQSNIIDVYTASTAFGIQGSNMAAGGVIDNVSLKAVTGGVTVFFGTQVTPIAGQLTFEAANYSDNPQSAVLLVEIVGGVLP